MDNTELGTSRSLEKAAVHSLVGADPIVHVPEGALHDGVQNVSLLVRSSLVGGKNGSESECFAVASGQSRFGSEDADEATGMFGLGCRRRETCPRDVGSWWRTAASSTTLQVFAVDYYDGIFWVWFRVC